MRAINRRLSNLEKGLGLWPAPEQTVWAMTTAERKLALDTDICVEILRECGFLPARRWVVVDLGKIPDGLNARETERFLRERGAETYR